MDKTSKKVTKDPKHVDVARKGRKKHMNKLKESIQMMQEKGSGDTTDASNETTSPTTNLSNETTSATNNASNETTSASNNTTTRSNDIYVYGVGILAVLAVGACVFFTYQVKNKKQDNDRLTAQHEQKQPPKRRHMP